MFKRFRKWLAGDYWVVRHATWPYDEGYATYNPAKKTVLDTGLTKAAAERICKELNAR